MGAGRGVLGRAARPRLGRRLLRAAAVAAVGAGLLTGPALPAHAVATPITAGTTVTVPSSATPVDYTLPLSLDQHVTLEITAGTTTAGTAILLIAPSGAVRDAVNLSGEVHQYREVVPLAETGTYTLEVVRDVGATGAFGLTVHVPASVTGTVTDGVPLPVSLGQVGQHASLTLPVVPGRLGYAVFRNVSLTPTPAGTSILTATVRRPGDPPFGFNPTPTELLFGFPLGGPGPLTLELAVTPGSTGTFTVDLVVAQNSTQAMTVGQPATVALSSRGGIVDLTFAGVRGQIPTLGTTGAVWASPLPSLSTPVVADLIRPNGSYFTTLGVVPEGASSFSSDALDVTGTWTVRLTAGNGSTGSATMTITQVPAPPADLTSGVLKQFTAATPGQTQRFTVRLVAGQTLGIHGDGGTMVNAAGVTNKAMSDAVLRRPNGTIAYEPTTPLRTPGWLEFGATESGLWTLELTAPVGWRGHQFFTPFLHDPPVAQPMALGVTTKVSLTTPGQNRLYSITIPPTGGVGAWIAAVGWSSSVRPAGSAGAKLILIGRSRGLPFKASMGFSTTGRTWGDTYMDPGPATLLVDGQDDSIGSMTVTLSAPVTKVQPITPSVRVTAGVADKGGRRALTFTGGGGLRVVVDVTNQSWISAVGGGSRSHATVSLLDANGARRGTAHDLGTAATGVTDLGRVPTSGPWTVLLDPVSDAVGSAGIRIRLLA